MFAFWTGASHGDQREVLERGGPAPHEVPKNLSVAGLRQVHGGDVVTAVNGQPIASQLDMAVALDKDRPGDTVTLEIYRGGQKMDVPLTLGEQTPQ